MTAWIILPYRDQVEMTQQALADCLDQTLPNVKVLLVSNGSRDGQAAFSDWHKGSRVTTWFFEPPLSLAGVWNTALNFVWQQGGEEALVVNNDVRLRAETYETLSYARRQAMAYFVSAVGVTQEQFEAYGGREGFSWWGESRGGPDFSCFCISRECHQLYQFDANFYPAYCEDLDYHRRLLLDGHGKKIFSINLPFLHYASGTLKGMTEGEREAHEHLISAHSREHYRMKWGGPVNFEVYTRPFDHTSSTRGVTTPELQARLALGETGV